MCQWPSQGYTMVTPACTVDSFPIQPWSGGRGHRSKGLRVLPRTFLGWMSWVGNTSKNSLGGSGDRVGQVKNIHATTDILLRSKQNEVFLFIHIVIFTYFSYWGNGVKLMEIKGRFMFISLFLNSQKQYHKDCCNCIHRIQVCHLLCDWRLLEVGTVTGILKSSLFIRQEIST